jgi:hypothetical protein
MALRFNTGTRNALADHLNTVYAGGTLQIRTGTQPASGNTEATGTLLVSVVLAESSPFQSAANGAIQISGTWGGLGATAGTAGWARFVSSDSAKTMDVSAGGTGSGADLILSNDIEGVANDEIVVGNAVIVDVCTLTIPSGDAE